MLASLCPKPNSDRPVRPTYPRAEIDFSQYRAAAPEAVVTLLGRAGRALLLSLAAFGPAGIWAILRMCGVV